MVGRQTHRTVNGGVIRWGAWAYCRRVIASVAAPTRIARGIGWGRCDREGGNAIGGPERAVRIDIANLPDAFWHPSTLPHYLDQT